jgi:anti-sigma-K factor RskA
MKCAEFHELAAAYVLEALGEEEQLACVHHLEHEAPHEGCEERVARYQRSLDALSTLHGQRAPSPALWRAIEARVAPAAPRPKWREPAAWALAAAALLAGLWLRNQGVEHAERERDTMEEALARTHEELASVELARKECTEALVQLTGRGALGRDAVSLLEHPSTKLTPLAPTGAQAYRATALYNADRKRALIVSSTLRPVEGKDFELWVIASGESAPRPAGFLHFDASGIALGELDPNLLTGKPPAAFAVSLEPAGGRPTPTEVVLVGKLQG